MKSRPLAPLIAGTISERWPLRSTSTAIPRLIAARLDHERLAVALDERAAHHRELLGGLDDGPGDEVGEGELHARAP